MIYQEGSGLGKRPSTPPRPLMVCGLGLSSRNRRGTIPLRLFGEIITSHRATNLSLSHLHSSVTSYLPPSMHPVLHEVSSPPAHDITSFLSLPKLGVSMLNTSQPQPRVRSKPHNPASFWGLKLGPTTVPDTISTFLSRLNLLNSSEGCLGSQLLLCSHLPK